MSINSDIDPDDAINKIITFSNQIDSLINMPYNEGEVVKDQLNTRIRTFVRYTFKDDEKKFLDYNNDLRSSQIVFVSSEESEEIKQKRYQKYLETMRNHLISYKDELELLSNSRKKKGESSTKNVVKKDSPPLSAQIRVYGIIGIIVAVVTGTSTINVYPNFTSVAIFGTFTLIFGILGIGCLFKPDTFGETLMLLLKHFGGNRGEQNSSINEQKQKNPKNSPQVINQGSGTVNVHMGTKSQYPNDEEE
jgi:hypothetical protein